MDTGGQVVLVTGQLVDTVGHVVDTTGHSVETTGGQEVGTTGNTVCTVPELTYGQATITYAANSSAGEPGNGTEMLPLLTTPSTA